MEIFTKELIGYISVFIGIAAQIPYCWLIWKRKVRPHAITFFLWSLIMGSVAYIQVIEDAGSGAWITIAGFVGVTITFLLAAFYHGERNITRSDWYCFFIAIAGWLFWVLTKNPLYAILFLTLADGLAYLPTFRKSWIRPDEESALFYFIGTMGFVLSFFAFDTYSFTNLFYPIIITILNISLPVMLWYRRAQLKN